MREGIPFEQPVEIKPDTAWVRVVVADRISGRAGSITIPVSAFKPKV